MNLTDHFSEEELGVRNASPRLMANALILAQGLEAFRAIVGAPCNVHDGYRSPEDNASIPGASATSDHCNALAADVDFEGMAMYQVWQAIDAAHVAGTLPAFDQIIGYPVTTGHIHFGFGPKARREQLVKNATGGHEYVTVKWLSRFPGAAP